MVRLMPTNKAQFTFNMEHEYLLKMKFIAQEENRSLSNLLEYLSRIHIKQYEEKHGEIKLEE